MLAFIVLAVLTYAIGNYTTRSTHECNTTYSVFVCDRDGYCLNTLRQRPLDIPYITRPSVEISRHYTHSVFKNC
jgi:hypothetical protein